MIDKAIIARGMRAPLRSLQERGIFGTLLATTAYLADYCFDWRNRVDTSAFVEVRALGLEGRSKDRAERYQPTRAAPLRKLFRTLGIQTNQVLVDLGCGKGKVLLVASEFGFQEVRGVEISPILCDTAKQNCSIWQRRRGPSTKFTVIEQNASDYKVRDDEDFFYLFNPFDAHILRCVAAKISKSLARRPRKIWILYRRAAHRDVIETEIGASSVKDVTYWGFDFTIFEIDRQARPPSEHQE